MSALNLFKHGKNFFIKHRIDLHDFNDIGNETGVDVNNVNTLYGESVYKAEICL